MQVLFIYLFLAEEKESLRAQLSQLLHNKIRTNHLTENEDRLLCLLVFCSVMAYTLSLGTVQLR